MNIPQRIIHTARMYSKLQVLHLRMQLEYEADFWIGIVAVALTQVAGIIFIWAIFDRVPVLVGWNLWEILFLYALSIIPRGLNELLGDGSWLLRGMVNRGEFDRLLVRPISPAVQLITQSLSVHGFGSIILGSVILLRALGELDLAWNAWHYLFLLLTIVNGWVIVCAIDFTANCVSLWNPSATSTFPLFVHNLLDFAKFPLALYDRLLQALITWVVPFAFVSYFPGSVLLGKPLSYPLLGYGAPIAGAIAVLITWFVWHKGLQNYQGTGS